MAARAAPTATPAAKRSHPLLPVIVVLFAVALNVVSGLVLKSLADSADIGYLLLGLGISMIVLINGLRFIIWTFAHKRYPLSTTYPLTSLLYPVMLAVAYIYHEPVGPNQWIGAIMITVGVAWLSWKVRT